MWTEADLPDLTDPATIGRGRAYARSGRVVAVRRRGDAVEAEVAGSETYRVRLTGSSWSCDCPVGVSGAFCKHCVAVVVDLTASESGPNGEASDSLAPVPPASAPTSPLDAWLATLDEDRLRDLLDQAAASAEVRALLAREHSADTGDLTEAKAQVEYWLKPSRRFYEYRQANAYVADAQHVLQLLAAASGTRPSLDLLRLVERAITLTVRTILRSDDSSGAQGDQIHTLLRLHTDVAAGLAGDLPAKERRRLATWLHAFRFTGEQDFFDPDVAAYAAALGPVGVERYRALVEESAGDHSDLSAVRYSRGRLAVLDRDAEAIVAVIGDGLTRAHQVVDVVQALDEAGFDRLAVRHAEAGLALPRSPHHTVLVDRLVRDAVERGDLAEATRLRHAEFSLAPGSRSLAAMRSAARASGEWETLRADAEHHLAEKAPWEWLGVLMNEDRDEEAWDFARAHPDAARAGQSWERLCARRVRTAPADTLPVYRDLVTQVLERADRGNYITAARLLTALRAAADAADRPGDFHAFLAATVEANRRRPTCLAEFRRAGLAV